MVDESYSFSLRNFEKAQNSNRNAAASIAGTYAEQQRNSALSIIENLSNKNEPQNNIGSHKRMNG
jgi:hypothetical protein